MKDNSEDRLAVGKQADDLGLILTVIGDEYRLHVTAADLEQPEFTSPDLGEVKDYLDRRAVDRADD